MEVGRGAREAIGEKRSVHHNAMAVEKGRVSGEMERA